MSDTSHVAFLGDRDHTFCLTPEMIRELERIVGTGIGAVFQRFASLAFSHVELCEVIRLGLIGGQGVTDKEAADLVASYVAPRPIATVRPLAWNILRAVWIGPAPAENEEQPEDAA